jgi:hypothetical protein
LNERRPVRWRVALPWLGALARDEAQGNRAQVRAEAAEWLAARGAATGVPAPAWREWLLEGIGEGAGLLLRHPAGPCLRALQAADPPQGTWACARPVHLLAAIDHLQLAPQALILDGDERAALADAINRHLDGHGYRLHAPGAGPDWLLECLEPVDCSSLEPERAMGRNLRELMPGGRDGSRVRALMNEIQMLLHEHPVNVARSSRGLPTANALWLWGFGPAGPGAAGSLPALYTDDPWLAGLWRLHGTAAQPIEHFPTSGVNAAAGFLVGWTRVPEGGLVDAIATIDAQCLSRARDLLVRGRIDELALLLGQRAFAVDRAARLRFWRRLRPLHEVLG